MSSDKIPVVIIGAGVVGCAIAEALARKGLNPLVLESSHRIAEGVTTRNSGVIHSGIYYPPKSLKAELCVRGQTLLYDWCQTNNVPHRKTGKYIVGEATDEAALRATMENAQASGAKGLTWMSKALGNLDIPGIKADIALYCAESGIVDPYDFTASLLAAAQENGADCLVNCRVESVSYESPGDILLETSRGPVRAEAVINAAGLNCDVIANQVGPRTYEIFPWRGDYFNLSSRFQFKQLIYPVKKKDAPGLGIHLTIALNGSCKLGPDVEFAPSKNDVSEPKGEKLSEKTQAFFTAAAKYIEGLKIEDLSYDTCGIRPKIRSPLDQKEHDFIISQDRPGFFNLIGIESPGLTAAMAIAERVSVLI